MKLDMGCGIKPAAGYTGIDLYVVGEGIVNAPMWKLPFPDDSIEEVYSCHALEHVPKRGIVPTLKEWHRVLEPGGMVNISVPDLEWCCREWLARQTNDWYMDIIFGNQDHAGEFHMTGFTRDILREYLEQAGFERIDIGTAWTHRQNTLVGRGYKGGANVPAAG